MEDWALIRRLVNDGVPKAQIARDLGISRTTVVKAAASSSPPKYERKRKPTSFTPYEARVRELLKQTPTMPATVLAERVGWEGSIRWFRDNVKRLRPSVMPIDPADRLWWAPGDVAQCDLWFPPKKIPLEDGTRTLLPVLVMSLAHSRFTLGRMLPTRKTEDLLLGTWEVLQGFEAVPRRLLWDNEPGIGRGKRHAQGVDAFMGVLGAKLVLLPPRDPESKGIVERRNGYFNSSFMPGRTFASPADFDAQFTDWLQIANARQVRTIKARPVDLLGRDREQMLSLPPLPPPLGFTNHIRLGRDYYVRVDTNDYSVDPSVIGQMVHVRADLESVQVHTGGQIVASHRRVWARGQTITDPVHQQIAVQLRHQFQHPTTISSDHADGLVRDLADYDRAFGVDLAKKWSA